MARPFVYVNMAMTADGKITSARREYPRFTAPHDRTRMDRLRAEADALVVGAGTMRADNPKLHVREAEMQAYRASLGKGGLTKVVVSASARIDADSRLFEESDGGARIVATIDAPPPENVSAIGDRAEIWHLGRDRVDPARLLERLGRRGAERVLLEGGGELNWEFFSRGLVDEVYVTLAPALLGGRDAPTPIEGEGLPMARLQRLRLISVDREGDELYCRYAMEPQ